MREHFLLDPGVVFLNHGSFGATPRVVLEAQQRWQREMERNPVEFLGRRSGSLLLHARQRLAAALGGRAERLVFVGNATTGVNIVARSVALAPGDEVLATDHEYGACDATWQQVCAERGATYRRVEIALPFERERFVGRLMAAVTPRTRLVFVSHIASTTALVFPVVELVQAARARGILTLVDGAHAPGQVPLDLETLDADYYTGNAHKWLCAPKGAGFLHVREPDALALAAPVISWGYVAEGEGGAGGTRGGHTGFDAYTGRSVLERRLQWLGTRDITPFLAVEAALDFQAAHVGPAARERCHQMGVALMHRLARRFGLPVIGRDDDFAQMVPIPVPHADAEALRRALWEDSRIEVPVTVHLGRTFVRASVQIYNDERDLAALEAAPALAARTVA